MINNNGKLIVNNERVQLPFATHNSGFSSKCHLCAVEPGLVERLDLYESEWVNLSLTLMLTLDVVLPFSPMVTHINTCTF